MSRTISMTYGNVAVKYTTWEEQERTSVREQHGPEHTVPARSTELTPRLGDMGRGQVRLLWSAPCLLQYKEMCFKMHSGNLGRAMAYLEREKAFPALGEIQTLSQAVSRWSGSQWCNIYMHQRRSCPQYPSSHPYSQQSLSDTVPSPEPLVPRVKGCAGNMTATEGPPGTMLGVPNSEVELAEGLLAEGLCAALPIPAAASE